MKTLTSPILILLALLAGCATSPPPPAPATTSPPSQASTSQVTPKTPVLKKETLAYLAKRGHKPITGQALNARASCNFRDDTGYRGQLELTVTNATVEQLAARVDVPNRGSCQFRLADFQQTETLPTVVLASRQSACKISLWEQGSQVTVAFRDCRAECGGDAVNYLWPILVDNQKGSCS
jgi:hypothetical protein